MERLLDSLPKMVKKPGFKEAWDGREQEYSLASALIEARMKSGMTRAEVAGKR